MAFFARTTTVRNFNVRDFRTHVSAVVRVVVDTPTVSLRHIARILLARLIQRAAEGHQALIRALYCHQAGGLLDVVIDDGSHFVDDMIGSFRLLFERVAPGGLYVIEDIHCAKDRTWG